MIALAGQKRHGGNGQWGEGSCPWLPEAESREQAAVRPAPPPPRAPIPIYAAEHCP